MNGHTEGITDLMCYLIYRIMQGIEIQYLRFDAENKRTDLSLNNKVS
jgi:hypothetical protein